MTTYSLTPYTMRILDPGGKALRVDAFLQGNDLLNVLEDYLLGLQANLYQNTTDRFILRVKELHKDRRFLYGCMDRGEYGIQSELFNTNTMKPAYTRKPEDAELLPYHFLIGVPKQSRRLETGNFLNAIAIFQMTDGLGIQNDFEDNFCHHFGTQFQPLHLNIEKMIPKKFLKQLLKRGRVTQLRFVQYKVPTTIEDMVKHGPIVDQGILEFRVKAKRGMAFDLRDRLGEVLDGKRSKEQFIGVEGFRYDDVKVQLESEGKYHTLNLGRLESTRAPYEYEITGRLAGMAQTHRGQKDLNPIDELAMEYCLGLAKEMDLRLQ